MILSIYTSRCAGGDGRGLEDILPAARTRFYGYGRQALAEAFRRAGVQAGDRIALPGFICKEVLASIVAVQAKPLFYAVDERLQADPASVERGAGEGVRTVVAVNYFGFPQPLSPLRAWCQRTGAALIEDNAHGLLSADGNTPLGRRGDLGVFSLRKTLALPNGAALVDNRSGAAQVDDGESAGGSPSQAERCYRLKAAMKVLMGMDGLRSACLIREGVRWMRRISMSIPAGLPAPDPEIAMPDEHFSSLAARLLRRCDLAGEQQRRRALYQTVEEIMRATGCGRPVFPSLPEGVVPLGYPLYAKGAALQEARRALGRHALQCVAWPELPTAINATAPGHYRMLHYVPFLW